jgi:hypothetical protein
LCPSANKTFATPGDQSFGWCLLDGFGTVDERIGNQSRAQCRDRCHRQQAGQDQLGRCCRAEKTIIRCTQPLLVPARRTDLIGAETVRSGDPHLPIPHENHCPTMAKISRAVGMLVQHTPRHRNFRHESCFRAGDAICHTTGCFKIVIGQ